jgi:hypothetical protein
MTAKCDNSCDRDGDYKFNPLSSNLVLWNHDINDPNWDLDSYKEIAIYKTIEDYWMYSNELTSKLINYGMFFLMKEGIMPTWEDKCNIEGGCISIKVSLTEGYNLWNTISAYLASDNFDDKINGISISPKRNFNIIKIWVKEEINMINYPLPEVFNLNNKIVLFRVHKTNIEKDKQKK